MSRRRKRRSANDVLPDGAAVVNFAFPDAIPGGPKKALRKALQEHGGDLRSLAEELLFEEVPYVAGVEAADHVTVSDVEDALEDLKYELGVEASRTLCSSCRNQKARRKQAGDTDLLVNLILAESTLDDFEKGAQPGTRQTVFEESNAGRFDSLQDLTSSVAVLPDPSKVEYIAFEDGRINASQMVNERNIPASDREVEEWKEGRLDLWIMDIDIYFDFAKTWKPSAGEISKELGIDTY